MPGEGETELGDCAADIAGDGVCCAKVEGRLNESSVDAVLFWTEIDGL